MVVLDKSIDARILECAREEFLTKSYEQVSLREICKQAEVTTGAFYNRYKNKEELFEAVVAPALNFLKAFSDGAERASYEKLNSEDMEQSWWTVPADTLKEIMRSLYEHKDGIRILLCRADGTKHANFLHDFVTDITRRSFRFENAAYDKGAASQTIDETELHMLLTAYWSTIFEPIIHQLPLEKALFHCEIVVKLFDWRVVFGDEDR
jgi:AcrR family transcriptional regulator